MKPLRIRIEEYRKQQQTLWEVVEKDYLLSWILEGISQQVGIQNILLFKGGTALRKCYFNEYRFSEDLDFSLHSQAYSSYIDLETSIKAACSYAEIEMNRFAPFRLMCQKYVEKQPHPDGQEAFEIRAQFPWHREPLCKIMIEVTKKEEILFKSKRLPIFHPYGEPLQGVISAYSLEEIILEKLRAVLQQTKKLHEGDFRRSRVRDYYDLWKILKTRHLQFQGSGLISMLNEKCAKAGVTFNTLDDFFDPILLVHTENTWAQWLNPLVPNLPSVSVVISELRVMLQHMLKT